MKKLLAFISSLAVCVTAVAVSVLSYFPSVKVSATAPDTSSLVTTTLSTNSSPVLTFTKTSLFNATSDIAVTLDFCPTGWVAYGSSYVSPSYYGDFTINNGHFVIKFTWSVSNKNFVVTSYANFGSGLAGKKVFSDLSLSNVNNVGGVSLQSVNFSSVCPSNSTFQATYLTYTGSYFDPSALSSDVVFGLTGTIGNDYVLWLTSLAYPSGYSDGYSSGYEAGDHEGYDAGQEAGYSAGYSNGYSAGQSAGYSAGYSAGQSAGYSAGNSAGYSSGYSDGNSAGYSSGYSAGYDQGEREGYDAGYADGYLAGYHAGQSAGYSSGYSDGNSAGYSSGYGDGRSDGYNSGYGDGRSDGYASGYNAGNSSYYDAGYNAGVNDGTSNFGMWDLFSNAFGSIGNILSIQLFPGLSVGLLISVPIAFAFILWLIHVLKG